MGLMSSTLPILKVNSDIWMSCTFHVNTLTNTWATESWSPTLLPAVPSPLELRLDMDVDSSNLPTFGWYDADDETPWLWKQPVQILWDRNEVQLDDNCIDAFGIGLPVCSGYTGTHMSIAIDNSDTNHAVFLNDVVGVENQYNQVPNGASNPSCNSQFQTNTNQFIEEDGNGINNDIAIKPKRKQSRCCLYGLCELRTHVCTQYHRWMWWLELRADRRNQYW